MREHVARVDVADLQRSFDADERKGKVAPSDGVPMGTEAQRRKSAGYIFLALLVAQNTSKTLIMRHAVAKEQRFLSSAAVLTTESLKCTCSCLWVLGTGGSPASIAAYMRAEWRTFVRVLLPAAIYNCQQMLELLALNRLEPQLFSLIVQSKLITTALFSVVLLGKRLRLTQYVALVLLLAGVCLAQGMSLRQKRAHAGGSSFDWSSESMTGVLATVGIALLSGFAAVYTEGVLKRGATRSGGHAARDSRGAALAYTQIQMATASVLTIGVFATARDARAIAEHGLWAGFDGSAMCAVASSAMGGLIVSAVLKYADSVLKGYATSGSVVLTGLLSSALFGTQLDATFLLAVAIVVVSIFLYNY